MISLEFARQLKEAGLIWNPSLHDFFAIPDRGLDDRVFVISNMLVNTELFMGLPIVTFQGTSEWALDYLVTSEAIWMPTEEQLRSEIMRRLPESPDSILRFTCTSEVYTCEIEFNGGMHSFSNTQAAETYAKALSYLLSNGTGI